MTDLLVKLYELPQSDDLINALNQEGVTIRRAMAYEKHVVVDWVRESFNNRWASECEVSFANRPISCFIATQNGQVIGFACHDSACRDFFGPTGVDSAHRGHGIGRALLLECLYGMREQGYAYAIIGGAGPIEFYVKAVGAIRIPDSTPGIYRDMLRG